MIGPGDTTNLLEHPVTCQAFRRVSQATDIAVNKAAETMTQLDQVHQGAKKGQLLPN